MMRCGKRRATVFYRNLEKMLKTDHQDEANCVSVPTDLFRRLLAGAIRSKNMFDERFYVEFYPDIAAAIKGRKIKTGLEHYLQAGYYENRLPRKLLVDESFYLQQYPDVADAIRRGKLKSAQDHFNNAGFNEGRLPFKDFSLF
jgi:hypothetical protein